MELRGLLTEVLESWPLQIAVADEQGRRVLPLAENATILRDGAAMGPGDLRPGQSVRLTLSGMPICALRVEILGE